MAGEGEGEGEGRIVIVIVTVGWGLALLQVSWEGFGVWMGVKWGWGLHEVREVVYQDGFAGKVDLLFGWCVVIDSPLPPFFFREARVWVGAWCGIRI